MSIFETTLRSAGLDQYAENFNAFGIDSLQSLTLLTMQGSSRSLIMTQIIAFPDYAMSDNPDHPRFQLIQHLKSESDLANPSPLQVPGQQKPGMSFLPKPAPTSAPSTNALKPSSVSSTTSIPSDDSLKQTYQRVPIQRTSSPNRASVGETQRESRRAFTNAEARVSNPPPPSTTNTTIGMSTKNPDLSDSEDEDEAVKIKYSFSPNRNPKAPQPLLNVYGVPNTVSNTTKTSQGGSSKISDISDRIRVCVRKRPLNKKELKSNQVDVANVLDRRTLVVNEPKVKVDLTKFVEQHEFTFDEVFDSDSTNDEVYKRLTENSGQTGSGKTYTMLDETNGLYVKAGRDIFKLLEKPEYQHLAAYVGFYEIYQRQDTPGKNGFMQEKMGSKMLLSPDFKSMKLIVLIKKSKKKVQGKLSFIDLAGSERGADRGDTDQRTRMEGSEINKSLLALKECIRALDQESKHTPFRQSKLTQVLKDSFIGNSRTCMIATISPSSGNSEHTLNTLRYAYRVKELKGDSQYQDEDAHDGLYDEPENDDFVSGDEDPFLDSEFPPENLLESDDGGNDTGDDSDNPPRVESQVVQASLPAMERLKNKSIPKHSSKLKPSMLAKPSSTSLRGSREALSESKSSLSHVNSTLSMGSKGHLPDLPAFEELVNVHRQHLRLFAELSKSESKLIVNYSMKGKSESSVVSQETYLAELSAILAQKEESISDLKGLLERFIQKK
ncbi:Kinesin-like protein kif24 [Entophlyctis luteolus]|nr:Kinesin-like protein kif24 [Entophlyctis luteolus]